MTSPSSETPSSITPKVPRQSSSQTASITGSAHHWKPIPVASCRAMHTPPSSAARVSMLTATTPIRGSRKKENPKRSRIAPAIVWWLTAASRPDISMSTTRQTTPRSRTHSRL